MSCFPLSVPSLRELIWTPRQTGSSTRTRTRTFSSRARPMRICWIHCARFTSPICPRVKEVSVDLFSIRMSSLVPTNMDIHFRIRRAQGVEGYLVRRREAACQFLCTWYGLRSALTTLATDGDGPPILSPPSIRDARRMHLSRLDRRRRLDVPAGEGRRHQCVSSCSCSPSSEFAWLIRATRTYAALITISHRPSLYQHHMYLLRLTGVDGGWEISQIGEAER